jgi:diguanylate cyclase (GGDEF)-like protein
MVDALRGASGADHVVVARLHPGERDLEAILVSASASVPLATTRLPIELLGARRTAPGGFEAPNDRPAQADPADGQPAFGPLVERLRSAFGLRNVVARPLHAEGATIGALLLSRRTEDPWSAPDVALLETAATELSNALQRAVTQEAAERGARIDALTGLPNRRHFDELAELLSRGRRAGDALGVLMIDIDHFKRINDSYGHAVGDAVLRAVAQSIASGVRAADTPARYGGEEFAVLLRRATTEQACDVALRVRAAVAALDTMALGILDGRPVSVSVGVAVGEASGETVAELVHRADDALYTAKRRGRDRVVVDEVAPRRAEAVAAG